MICRSAFGGISRSYCFGISRLGHLIMGLCSVKIEEKREEGCLDACFCGCLKCFEIEYWKLENRKESRIKDSWFCYNLQSTF